MEVQRLKIENLPSFLELNDRDRERCYDRFYNEKLEDKNKDNKYLKRTSYIFERGSIDKLDNECFLTFDLIQIHRKFSALIFSLCGIARHFHYILFLGIIEDAKMENLSYFVCEILANLLTSEIPKLANFPLKFILLRNNITSQNVLKLFSQSKKTISLFRNFLFINEPSGWRLLNLQDPYTQSAWDEIMLNFITDRNIHLLFGKYELLAADKGNESLQRFVKDFRELAKNMLTIRRVVSLRLCTLERLDIFEKIVMSHTKVFKEHKVNRMLMFQLLRAIIIIYGY